MDMVDYGWRGLIKVMDIFMGLNIYFGICDMADNVESEMFNI